MFPNTRKLGNRVTAILVLPLVDSMGELKLKPKEIFGHQLTKNQNWAMMEILVRWQGQEKEELTWESMTSLRKLTRNLWARCSKGRGSPTTLEVKELNDNLEEESRIEVSKVQGKIEYILTIGHLG